jgi:hypothetical protein
MKSFKPKDRPGYLDLVEPAHMTFARRKRRVLPSASSTPLCSSNTAWRVMFFNWSGFDEGDKVRDSGATKHKDNGIDRDRAILPRRR